MAQIALASVSLIAAGLVTRSFVSLQQVDLAFEPGRLLVVPAVMRPDQLGDRQRQRDALDRALSNIHALPGVRDVTPAFAVPFVGSGGGVDGRVSAPGQSEEERVGNSIVNMDVATANYFAMLGIPLLRGRSFSDEDREGSEPVVVISSSVARRFWPGADPTGEQLESSGRDYTVVGVVPDTRYRELQSARPTVYFAFHQSPLPRR